MNKFHGNKADFAPIKEDASRVIISYGKEDVDKGHATWYEIHFYKKQLGILSLETVKQAIIDDIDAKTKEKIQSGFTWHDKPVWLSENNQRNFADWLRVAEKTNSDTLLQDCKIGEDAEGKAVLHSFESVEELSDFNNAFVAYIAQCLREGWQTKDAVDWDLYKTFFPAVENNMNPE